MLSGRSIVPAFPIPFDATSGNSLLHPDFASCVVCGLRSVVGDVSVDAIVEGSNCAITSFNVCATEFQSCSVSSGDNAIMEISPRRLEIVSLLSDFLDICDALLLMVFCNVFVKCRL